jgi:hypothetical protein
MTNIDAFLRGFMQKTAARAKRGDLLFIKGLQGDEQAAKEFAERRGREYKSSLRSAARKKALGLRGGKTYKQLQEEGRTEAVRQRPTVTEKIIDRPKSPRTSPGGRTYAREKASAARGEGLVRIVRNVGIGAGALGLGAAGGVGLYHLLRGKKKAK